MATVPSSFPTAKRGIENTISNSVVQTETITETAIVEQIPDQNGAIGDEQKYDTRFDLKVQLIASAAPSQKAGDTFTYAGKTWKVDSVEDNGTYNTVRKWTIVAHRYDNFPAGN